MDGAVRLKGQAKSMETRPELGVGLGFKVQDILKYDIM